MKEVPRSPERATGYNPKKIATNDAPNPCLFLVPRPYAAWEFAMVRYFKKEEATPESAPEKS